MAARQHDVLLAIPSASECQTLGYMHARGHDYAIRIRGPLGTPECRVDVCDELADILRGHETIVARRLAQCRDAAAFVAELREIVEQMPAIETARSLPSQAYYAHLIDELDGIGWQLLTNVSASLDALELTVQDDAGRSHSCTVRLPAEYPLSAPEVQSCMPAEFEVVWTASSSRAGRFELATLVEQFRLELGKYQRTWDMLDDIDTHTAVLEPHAPTRDQCTRRLAFGRHSSLQLRINPLSPDALPELFFFGSEAVVAPMRAKLNERLGLWDARLSVRLNLQAVLEVAFPQPTVANQEELSVECGVCYSYRLEGVIPESACDGCNQVFHHSCLLEWLQALPNCQQSFDTVFGTCPYCSKPISTKMHSR